MKLSGRVVLITGGTSGIGLALTRLLVARGNTVLVTGRDRTKLDDVQRELPGVQIYQSDVSDPAQIALLHSQVLANNAVVDVLINNAGIMRNLKLAAAQDIPELTREIDIDLNGPVRMVQQFLPTLRASKEGLIVNVSSGLAFVPLPISPVYSAAKAGLHAYSKCLREQLRDTSVKVVELAPPPIETPLFRREFEEEMRGEKAMAPAELARRAIAGIEAGRLEIRPGVSNVLAAMSRIAPKFMFGQMAKLGLRAAGGGQPT